MANEYLEHIAELTGLKHYPKQGPFGKKGGAAIGTRDGYVLAIGMTQKDRSSAVVILVRYRQVDAALAKQAVESSSELPQALGVTELSSGQRKQLQVGADALTWTWTYSLRKPKAEEVAAMAAALVKALKGVASPFAGKCELCNTATAELALLNDVPGHYCHGCHLKTQHELDAAAFEYENKPTNFPRGVLFGVVAALAGSVAWGLVAYGIHRIFLWGAILIGLLVAKAVFMGMGKVTRVGQIMIALLTVGSVIFGDAIFYTLSVMKEANTPFSGALLSAVLRSMWELEISSEGGIFSIIFALVGAGYVLYTQRKPAFKARFEALGTEMGKAAPSGM